MDTCDAVDADDATSTPQPETSHVPAVAERRAVGEETMTESSLDHSREPDASPHQPTFHLRENHDVEYDDDDDNDVGDPLHRCLRSSNHLHPQLCHQQHHLAQQRGLHVPSRGRGLLGTGYGSTYGESVGIGGSGSFSGGSDVGSSSKSKKRPVIHYLPSAGGVKKLGLAAVASESVVTGESFWVQQW